MSKSCTIMALAVLFSLSAGVAAGQTVEEASLLFTQKQFAAALIAAQKIIAQNPSSGLAYLIAGRSLAGEEKFSEAIPYLQKVNTFYDTPLYAKAWAFCELGTCYYSKGNYQDSKQNFIECIRLNATKTVNASAAKRMLVLGFDTLYNSWGRIESAHFIFHFQDSSFVNKSGTSRFITMKETAFDSINVFFRSTLPKKIDYFIWSDTTLGKSVFRRNLAFSDAVLCLTHTEPAHTPGHEMTHSISFHAENVTVWKRIISEGVCVYFDQSGRNNFTALKDRVDSLFSIAEIWKSDAKKNDDVIYPLGGELVKRLIQNGGREKFMAFFADQSYEHAKKIYGNELDRILADMEEELRK